MDYTTTKQIFSDSNFTNQITVESLINPPKGYDTLLTGKHTEIYARDSYSVVSGTSLGTIYNAYKQAPAPLPILGVGAAFGFSRKLRGRIKASRTA